MAAKVPQRAVITGAAAPVITARWGTFAAMTAPYQDSRSGTSRLAYGARPALDTFTRGSSPVCAMTPRCRIIPGNTSGSTAVDPDVLPGMIRHLGVMAHTGELPLVNVSSAGLAPYASLLVPLLES